MTRIDRRTFLAGSAALPFALAAFRLDAQEADAIDRLVARTKATGRWGLVLVAPEEPGTRLRLGQDLWALTAFEKDGLDAQGLLCQVGLAVLPEEAARKRFPALPAGANRALLSPEGALLLSDRFDPAVCSGGSAFAGSFAPFVHGADGARLAERAAAVERGLDEEARSALRALDSEELGERLAARGLLCRSIERWTPLAARLATSGPSDRVRLQARQLLTTYYASLPASAPERVPFGCSGPHYYSPCPGCGLMSIPERSRQFLKVLTGKPEVPSRDE